LRGLLLRRRPGCTPCPLNAPDTTLAFVSRAPQAEIHGFKERMGWDIPWYTISDDFDADFDVDK
jgi:predicted dithiol-disulfide oxidoreductase (DUF899 family)